MPFNGSGTYSPPGAGFPFVTASAISSTTMNGIINDMSTALSNCVTRDGQSPLTAAMPLGGQVLNNLGAGSAAAPAINFSNGATTGIYSLGANTFGVSIQGAASLTIASTRQVTIAQPVSGDALTLSGTGVGRAANWIGTSDRRLKSNIIHVELEEALEFARHVRACKFLKLGAPDLGLIAQEVRETELGFRAVREGSDGYYGIDYGSLAFAVLLPLVQHLLDQQEPV